VDGLAITLDLPRTRFEPKPRVVALDLADPQFSTATEFAKQ